MEWSETTPRTCSDGAASVSEVFQDIEAELQRVTPTTDGKHAAIRVELTYGHSERPSYAHEDPCPRPAGTGYSLRLQRQVALAKGGVTSISLEGGIVLTLERVQ